jgi:hypothetical protein
MKEEGGGMKPHTCRPFPVSICGFIKRILSTLSIEWLIIGY